MSKCKMNRMRIVQLMLVIALFVAVSSCSKSSNITKTSTDDIIGTWKLKAENSNEFWGGPFLWKNTDRSAGVRFTENGEYFRKESSQDDFKLMGTYVIMDNQLAITAAVPYGSDPSHYNLEFNFDEYGHALLKFRCISCC